MDLSKIGYNELAVKGLKEILKQISRDCKNLGIDFFIVGAIARNIWYVKHGEVPLSTKDIDIAVCVPTVEEYNKLRKSLIENYEYRPSSNNAFCLMSPSNSQIDLLPFGEIEDGNQVIIEGKGLTEISLEGFVESYEFGLSEVQIGNEKYYISSIPSIIILKLIAFDDRPNRRIKDVKDINQICKYYPLLESEHIWSDHNDLYTDDRSHDEVGWMVLGRGMGEIISHNPQLKTRILKIINDAISGKSIFLHHMIVNSETETLEQKKKILTSLTYGISN